MAGGGNGHARRGGEDDDIPPTRAFVERVRATWRAYRSSLLFVPTLMTLAAIGLFALTSLLDNRLWREGGVEPILLDTTVGFLVFGGSGEAAQLILSTIAGSWATIGGIAYSVTLVTIQLSATKYSAQVIPSFERDPLNQFTLGAFTGTVVYSLLVLKTVRVEADDGFVPFIGVNVALVLAVLSLLVFIWFVGNLTAYMRPTRFVHDLAEAAKGNLDKARAPGPTDGFDPVREDSVGSRRDDEDREWHTYHVKAHGNGYLVRVDWPRVRRALRRSTREDPLTLHVLKRVNDRVSDDTIVMSITGPRADPDLRNRLWSAFRVSGTPDIHDPTFAAEAMGDIGVTALSGGATDTGVARSAAEALMQIASADLEQPPVVETYALDAPGDEAEDGRRARAHVTRRANPPYTRCLLEASRVLQCAVRQQHWLVAEGVINGADGALRAAASAEDKSRWRHVLAWLGSVLDDITVIEDRAALGRMRAAITSTCQSLKEEDYEDAARELTYIVDRHPAFENAAVPPDEGAR